MPKTITLLLIIFSFSVITEVIAIFNYSTSVGYILFNLLGIGYTYFIYLALQILFEGSIIWFLLRPKSIGFWIAILSLFLSTCRSIYGFLIAAYNIDAARTAAIMSRQARGMPAFSEEVFKIIFYPPVTYIILGLAISFNLVLVSLLVWKRNYFFAVRV
jgi:hypothetical protein